MCVTGSVTFAWPAWIALVRELIVPKPGLSSAFVPWHDPHKIERWFTVTVS